jgi:hypothetical protein
MANTYFTQFPTILYTVDGTTAQLITDFLRRVSITEYASTNAVIYSTYDIQDGERPEDVADQFYGSSDLWWIVLLTNNITDPRYDWCLSTENLLNYCQKKYSNIDAAHHWIDTNGLIVDQSNAAFPVSNFMYEDGINESKRQIKILLPQLVSSFVKDFNTMVNS